MGRQTQKLLTAVALVLGALFLLFVVNQTLYLADAAARLSPLLGGVVGWGLFGLYVVAGAVVAWHFLRLPKTLLAPTAETGPDFDAYLQRLRRRLRDNPRTAALDLGTRAEVEAALETLGEAADDATRAAALQAFFVTAISQNGNLDALAVLAIQGRLVYDIAALYFQRPTWRDLFHIYKNVVVSALVARQLEEWDMTEYLTPIVHAGMGSAIGVVPGGTAVAAVAAQAVLTGSANAYMTLRVGVIAKRYCGSLTRPRPEGLRHAAFVEGAKMFPGIVGYGTKKVFEMAGQAALRGTKSVVGAARDTVQGWLRRAAGKGAAGEVAAGREKGPAPR